jgi:hypothetical protein
MKLTKYTILTLFIIIPILIINSINSRILIKADQTKLLYENLITNAANDATLSLKNNTEVHINYNNEKEITTNVYEVINTFTSSLYYGFKAFNELNRINIKSYIPVVIIIGYDGYYVYSARECVGLSGQKEIHHTTSPKKHYSYNKSNLIISFTLDDYVEIYDTSKNKLYKGNYNSINILDNTFKENFNSIRRDTIIKGIKEELEYSVNKHNKYAKDLGIIYNFNLPTIDSDIWGKTIEDIGIIVSFQGKRIGTNRYLNIFTMKNAEIIKKKVYKGYINKEDGKKYYCKEGCNKLRGQKVRKEFMNPLEGAKEGFRPCPYCKP